MGENNPYHGTSVFPFTSKNGTSNTWNNGKTGVTHLSDWTRGNIWTKIQRSNLPALFPSKAKPEKEDGGDVHSATEGSGEGFEVAKEGCGVRYMVSMQEVKERYMLSMTREQKKTMKFNWVKKDLFRWSSARTSAFRGQNFLLNKLFCLSKTTPQFFITLYM